MKFTFNTRIIKVFERRWQRYISGHGADTVFDNVSEGWYLQFGQQAIYVGMEKPTVRAGEKVRITIETGEIDASS